MLLTEYDEAETLEMFKRDYLAEGRAEGLTEGMAKGLNEGMVKGEERERLNTIRKLMKSLKMTASQAMALLEIPSSEQGKYLDRL
jgi:flagellar biosynthesis/type III secretory pathway protein FliH